MKIFQGLAALTLLALPAIGFGFAALPIWVNGTGVWQEADQATLISPATISMNSGDTTPSILGTIYKDNLTESPGPAPSVVAELGYGAYGSDPRYSTWTWLPVSYNQQLGNADEYSGDFSILAPGTYAYTYRFSEDNGGTWTAADLAGDGENPAVAFNPGDIGTLTVNTQPVPEPAAASILGLSALLLIRRRA